MCDESLNLIKSSRDTSLLNPQKNKLKPQKKGIFLILFFHSSYLIFLQTHIDSIFTVGWKRRSGQQEDPYHPPSPAAGGAQRRGAEQTPGPSDHRSGRRAAQHPGRAAAQEDRETRQNQINTRVHKTSKGSFKSHPFYLPESTFLLVSFISSDYTYFSLKKKLLTK